MSGAVEAAGDLVLLKRRLAQHLQRIPRPVGGADG